MSLIKVGKNEIAESVNFATRMANEGDVIELVDSFYHEKVIINKNNITIKSNINSIISFDDHYNKLDKNDLELMTVRTHTMIIKADNVTLENITIENSAGRSYEAHQAVALHLYGDNIVLRNCTIRGSQDTLFTGPLPDDLIKRYERLLPNDERLYNKEARHYFYNCHIIGDIDFIFGGGNDYFENCTIECLNNNDKPSYICAPSHEQRFEYGMYFKNCKIIGDAKKGSVYLARPWRNYGKVTFDNCYLEDIIHEEGFIKWKENSENTCRFYEINSKGPGSNQEKRVKWIKK